MTLSPGGLWNFIKMSAYHSSCWLCLGCLQDSFGPGYSPGIYFRVYVTYKHKVGGSMCKILSLPWVTDGANSNVRRQLAEGGQGAGYSAGQVTMMSCMSRVQAGHCPHFQRVCLQLSQACDCPYSRALGSSKINRTGTSLRGVDVGVRYKIHNQVTA